MIEIQKIKSDRIDDIISTLVREERQPFEIYCPKSTVIFSSSNEDIAEDYARLAFAGHKLNLVSDQFEYEYVGPAGHASILFEVTTSDLKKLAKALLELSYLYNNDIDNDRDHPWEKVYQYIEDVENEILIPVCAEFIDISSEFLNNDDDNNDT